MTKVYIKFGEPIDDEDHIYVYEGILEGNVVKLILPSALYSTCINVARDIEQPGYLVEGRYVGSNKNGQLVLIDYKIISKLIFDKNNECYICKNKITEPERNPKPKMPSRSKAIDVTKTNEDTLTTLIGFGIGRLIRGINNIKHQKHSTPKLEIETECSQKRNIFGGYKYKPYTN